MYYRFESYCVNNQIIDIDQTSNNNIINMHISIGQIYKRFVNKNKSLSRIFGTDMAIPWTTHL